MIDSNIEFQQIYEIKEFNKVSIVFCETLESNKLGIGFLEETFNNWKLVSEGGFIYFKENENISWQYTFAKIKKQSYPILYGTIYDSTIDNLLITIIDNKNNVLAKYKKINTTSIDSKRKLWYVILEEQLTGKQQIEIIGLSENGKAIYENNN